MVNNIILKYLELYKEKFSVDDLKKEILEKGYSVEEFNEAWSSIVSNNKKIKYKSLDEHNPKATSKKKKGKTFGIISSVILFLVLVIIVLNFLNIDIAGFNIFDIFN